MATVIETSKRFQDLMSLQSHGLPYVFDRIFNADGWRARSLSKKKYKLLKKIDSKVRAMLSPEEKVYFITTGVQSSFLESYFLGWLMYYINRMAFIFTTERILLLQISSWNEPLELKSQIRYTAIAKIGNTVLGNCKIKFQDGKTTVFVRIPKRDRKFMQGVIEQLKGLVDASKIEVRAKENLCPHCYVPVSGFPPSCPHCQKTFKSANKATWLSLIFPGLGDFYLGHRALGAIETLGACFVWSSLFIPDKDGPLKPLDLLIAGVFVFVFMHGMDSLVTRHVARKGLYPSKS